VERGGNAIFTRWVTILWVNLDGVVERGGDDIYTLKFGLNKSLAATRPFLLRHNSYERSKGSSKEAASQAGNKNTK